MALPTAQEVVSLFVWGTNVPPSDKSDPKLIRATELTVDYPGGVDLQEYMEGPGRFATPEKFEIIASFFSDLYYVPPGEYNELQLRDYFTQVIGISVPVTFNMQQLNYNDFQDNYVERVLLWNTGSFEINDDAKFVVESDGAKRIENLKIFPTELVPGTFDFDGGLGSELAQFLTNYDSWIDPFGIGRSITFNWTGDVQAINLTQADYDIVEAGGIGGLAPTLVSFRSAIVWLADETPTHPWAFDPVA